MDNRIDKIIDRLLNDALVDEKPGAEKAEKMKLYNYPWISQKDLLQITQNFLEFKYPKQTRSSTTEPAEGEEKVSY